MVSTDGGMVSVLSWATAGETAKTTIASMIIPGVNFHCIPGILVLGKLK
jgi:hypothetical protein